MWFLLAIIDPRRFVRMRRARCTGWFLLLLFAVAPVQATPILDPEDVAIAAADVSVVEGFAYRGVALFRVAYYGAFVGDRHGGVNLYFDVDNNPATGTVNEGFSGVEYTLQSGFTEGRGEARVFRFNSDGTGTAIGEGSIALFENYIDLVISQSLLPTTDYVFYGASHISSFANADDFFGPVTPMLAFPPSVPAPSAYLLVGAALLGMAVFRRS
jgi:hypothetical protein